MPLKAKMKPLIGLFLPTILRIFVFCVAVYLSGLTEHFALGVMKTYFGYEEPKGFFGFKLDFNPLFFASMFWGSVFFGALGKKVDYILLGILIILGVLAFLDSNFSIYPGLFGAVILGSLIGYVLKLARLRWVK